LPSRCYGFLSPLEPDLHHCTGGVTIGRQVQKAAAAHDAALIAIHFSAE
jgi:hypothetical protein